MCVQSQTYFQLTVALICTVLSNCTLEKLSKFAKSVSWVKKHTLTANPVIKTWDISYIEKGSPEQVTRFLGIYINENLKLRLFVNTVKPV